MSNLKNKVQLIGNLGMDPEVKMLDSGRKVAKLRIATNEVYNNKKGERVTETEWHTVKAWGNVAELAEQLLQKGHEVMIDGKLTYSEYTGSDGVKRRIAEVEANSFLLLDKKRQPEPQE